jgi:type I restriction enzyme S subunit
VIYRAYDKYQPINGGWFSDFPNHWSTDNCRAIIENIAIKNNDGLEHNYLSLMANVGIIPYEEKGNIGNKKPDDLSKCKIVKRGNLVINSMNYSIGSYGM